MSVAIRFENVSKLYRLGETGTGTIANDLHRAWAKLRGMPDPLSQVGVINDREASSEKNKPDRSGFFSRVSEVMRGGFSDGEHVWALSDISFDVQQGEIIGIIGRNGAGKSTLLKILSRVTAPTSGYIKAKGRIASLLEVGTGFHPELTGRDNIFLNGAILGMRHREIAQQLDNIVEFSGCAKYLDTPVKRYSSGMMVRLGFAVAAHLQCEILIVDEVLAVGDAEFQRRCIGRMRDVAGQGRTVIFVSHAMATISSLCKSAILLEKGQLRLNGRTPDVVASYLSAQKPSGDYNLSARKDRKGNGQLKLREIQFLSPAGERQLSVQCGAAFVLRTNISATAPGLRLTLAIGIDNEQGVRISHLNTACVSSETLTTRDSGDATVDFLVRHNPLVPGSYMLTIFLTANGEISDWIEQAVEMQVIEGDFFGTGKLPPRDQGSVLIPHSISTEEINRS
jgi:lipopolysaccharide transport system ATP-binding protein